MLIGLAAEKKILSPCLSQKLTTNPTSYLLRRGIFNKRLHGCEGLHGCLVSNKSEGTRWNLIGLDTFFLPLKKKGQENSETPGGMGGSPRTQWIAKYGYSNWHGWSCAQSALATGRATIPL